MRKMLLNDLMLFLIAFPSLYTRFYVWKYVVAYFEIMRDCYHMVFGIKSTVFFGLTFGIDVLVAIIMAFIRSDQMLINPT